MVLSLNRFPPKPEGVTVVKSKSHHGVTISYKEPGLCETTPGVKTYAGIDATQLLVKLLLTLPGYVQGYLELSHQYVLLVLRIP
jgi:hypothetical protein